RLDDKVGGARPDTELFVVRNRCIQRVEREKQVRHHGAVPEGGFEGVGTQGLATKRAVHVGDDKEHELDVLARRNAAHPCANDRATSASACPKRRTRSEERRVGKEGRSRGRAERSK